MSFLQIPLNVWLILSLLGLTGLVTLYRLLYPPKPRVPPGLPILNYSSLPGKAGEVADVEAYVKNGSEVVQKGYDLYSRKGKNFLMRTPEGLAFVAAPRFIDEIQIAPVDGLSPMANNNKTLQVKYTIHHVLDHDWYEFGVIRKQLTQSLGPGLNAIVQECHLAFSAELKNPTDWVSKQMWPLASRVVTRTANRTFFGEKLAGDSGFLQLSTDYTNVVFGGAHILRQYPEFLRPLIIRLKTDILSQKVVARKYLGPLLEERIRAMDQVQRSGDMTAWQKEKPNDIVQWLLDITPPEKLQDIDLLIARLLHLITAAVHTSAGSFLDAVCELALHPEIHDEIKEEITTTFRETGRWSKQALTKMVKIDSFMRESARWHPFLAGSLEREAIRDFPLKDGSIITKGTKVTVPHYAMYFDEDIYGQNAHEFDAFRFSKMRAVPGQEMNHSFVQTGPKFLHFGHGKHACPGRFFASNEIKVLIVYMLSMYEIRYPRGQPKPRSTWIGGFRSGDQQAAIEWKLREKPLVPLEQLLATSGD